MFALLVAALLLWPIFAPVVWFLSLLVELFIPEQVGLRRRLYFSVGIATVVAVIASTVLLTAFGDTAVILIYVVNLLLAAPIALGARFVFSRSELLAEKKGKRKDDEDSADTSV